MGEGRASRQSTARLNDMGAAIGLGAVPIRLGAILVTVRGAGLELYFPPLRAAASALMLALFGGACVVLGAAATAGLLQSGDSQTASMLALAFAGVFALPLAGVGLMFIAIALWTAANSLTVEVSNEGLRTARRWCGYTIARREVRGQDIGAIDSCLAAKYVGVFSPTRYYRLLARSRGGALLIADSLKGAAMTEEVKRMIVDHLGLPELATQSAAVLASAAQDQT